MDRKGRIIARVLGGLGNQLFIYAAARRMALVNDAELIMDDVSGFAHDREYQRHFQLDHFNICCQRASATDRLEPFGRLRRYVKRRWNMRQPFERRSYIRQERSGFDSRLLYFQPRGTVYLEGYWQSEGYFKDVEEQIRRDLRIQPPADTQNQAIANQIGRSTAVAVHVRFFDGPQVSNADGPPSNNADRDYYHRAFAEIEQRVPSAHYFVFSDRPEPARTMMPLPEKRVTIVDHNQGDNMAYADLWLMTQCQHFVIANSTFSWWGAWLANNPEKIIIAPGFGKRDGRVSWGFKGLLPAQWLAR
jgi:hypothetical protein